MFILIIFLLIGIAFKREIKTIISFLFLGFVVMYFWEDIKLIAVILCIFGCLLTLYMTIVSIFTKEKAKALKYILISLLFFLIVCIGIVNDDTSAIQIEEPTISVQKQLKI